MATSKDVDTASPASGEWTDDNLYTDVSYTDSMIPPGVAPGHAATHATNFAQDVVARWRARRLDPVYAMVFFDAMRIKARERGAVRAKAVHAALGVRGDGGKDLLALWIEPSGRYWVRAMEELRARGLRDMLFAVADDGSEAGLAIRAAYPDAVVQTGLRHLVARALDAVPARDKPAVAQRLDAICEADDVDAARRRLEEFAGSDLGQRVPPAVDLWRRRWSDIAAAFALPPGIRSVMLSTTASASIGAKLKRRAVRMREHFPSDEAALRQIVLLLRDTGGGWKVAPNKWAAARSDLARCFADRCPLA